MRDPLCNTDFVSFGDVDGHTPLLGVSGDWPVLPRTPESFPTDTPVYLETVAGWLTDQAPSQPIVVINKIWRVDLEGDGVDEVIIDASRFAEASGHNVEPRDYSVILMRKVSGNDVVRLEIVGDYYGEAAENAFPLSYSLEFVGDLNGDGVMEIVVGISRWEGMGVMVFEVNGTNVVLALSVMCSL
jgi:hypothetical protein